MEISQVQAIYICLLLATTGLAITTAELLLTKAFFGNKLLSVIVCKNWWFNFLGRIHRSDNGRTRFINVILIIRLVHCILLLAALLRYECLVLYSISVTVVTSLIISASKQVGNDGADQMNNIIYISTLLYFMSENAICRNAVVIFISAQSLLSYFTAGYVKLTSAAWMKSNAVGKILGSLSYGQPFAFNYLRSNETLGIWLSRFVVFFELLLPLCIFLPYPYCLVILGLGALFHINCGIWMGLNDFIWSFISTYPLLIWLNLQI